MQLYISQATRRALLGDKAQGFTGSIGSNPVFTNASALPNIENVNFYCANANVLKV